MIVGLVGYSHGTTTPARNCPHLALAFMTAPCMRSAICSITSFLGTLIFFVILVVEFNYMRSLSDPVSSL